MKPNTLPIDGACRCGATRIRLSATPRMTAACHCTGCQRMSSSAFSLTAMVPAEGFEVTQGEVVVGGAKSPELQHFFCPDCMTWMFTRITGFDALVNIRPTLLDDCTWFVPFIETMTREKLDWAETPATHSFEGFPDMADFEALMQAFAQQA